MVEIILGTGLKPILRPLPIKPVVRHNQKRSKVKSANNPIKVENKDYNRTGHRIDESQDDQCQNYTPR